MTIEIWSDIMCPFCYIGKRHLEAALAQFDHAEEVEVEWFSYQLDPSLPTNSTGQNVYDYLAERKGINRQESVAMHKHVEQMAAKAGLEYHCLL